MAAAAAGAAAAAMTKARRRLIEGLREQAAFSPETAAPIPIQRRLDQRLLDRLLRDGVVIQDGPERYHLDEARLAQVDAAQRRLSRIVIMAMVAVILAAVAVAVIMIRFT